MDFNNYGGKEDFLAVKDGKVAAFVEKSGGPVDPYGDEEKKEKDAMNMNAAGAFNKKDLSKIDAEGTDYPKKSGKPGQFEDNKGDHFKTEEENDDVDPFGTDCAKSKSWQTSTRK